MNRNEASNLAHKTSGEQIKQMILNAQSKVKDWTIASRPNKGLSLGVAFNIFSKIDWDKFSDDHLMKTNAIWAFGEYLPDYDKPIKNHPSEIKVTHQEPKFIDDDIWNNF